MYFQAGEKLFSYGIQYKQIHLKHPIKIIRKWRQKPQKKKKNLMNRSQKSTSKIQQLVHEKREKNNMKLQCFIYTKGTHSSSTWFTVTWYWASQHMLNTWSRTKNQPQQECINSWFFLFLFCFFFFLFLSFPFLSSNICNLNQTVVGLVATG